MLYKWNHTLGSLLKSRLSCLEQFQIHSKMEQKIPRVSIYPLPQYMHSLPHYQHPLLEWHMYYHP